ncbi:response regulator [Chitinophaga nivalis]|uniref:Response regulatory domain-containing protein n=1 Tax=Chitinophaga nivalis TaxID=2991709 RepID=A0ABT3II83_9BACT|nr:hypothetical protein [Chitinophaga nivalis]MCW3466642.1 hypothetical protein [Chitinophaga nivalis]MCW3483667.1 hypothetical protein [Chitinophaga nivalis]
MKRKILITENNADSKFLLFSLLKGLYDISFENDVGYLLTGNFEKPDLFILNSYVSESSILAVCKQLKANARLKDVPILIISGSADIEHMMKACPGDDFIRKPFGKSTLLAKIATVIQRKATSLNPGINSTGT